MDLTPIAQKIFANDTFATEATGIHIDYVDEDTTICSLQLDNRHLNAKGSVMGGAIFTLADFAFAIAANSSILAEQKESLQWVSSSSTIHFLSSPKGHSLKATTTRIKQGRTQALFQVSITDSTNRQIALVSTTGTKITT
ncbi:MAG: PaaI family thioesterase [Bacteroidales bacterium]|nr:PaaI family thioesterase [Bacteroidales bacterium]